MSSKKLEKNLYRPQVGVDTVRQPSPPLISSAARFPADSRVLLLAHSRQPPVLRLLFPSVGSLSIPPTSIPISAPNTRRLSTDDSFLPPSKPSCREGRLAAIPPPGARIPPGFTSLRPSPKPRILPQKSGRLAAWSSPAIESAPHPELRLGDSCSGRDATPPAAQARSVPGEPATLLPPAPGVPHPGLLRGPLVLLS